MYPYGLIADLHLHAWSSFATTMPDGQNSRLVGLLNEIERCAKEVKAAGGRHIIVAGDVFHVRGSVLPSVQNATRDRMTHISATCGVEFVVMPGNHDLEGKESTRLSSAVTTLESPTCRIVSSPERIGDLVLVPWVENIDDLKAVLKDPHLDAKTDLILHAPIDGVIKGLPMHGLDPAYLASLPSKRVFAGHYHNHKHFDGDVYSIGALAHHTWSDIGTRAGFLLVYPDRVEWRKSHLPEFIDLSQLADVSAEELPMLVDQNYVRVKVEASKTKEVEAARQELLDMGARAVIVQAMPKPPARAGLEHMTIASGASLEVSVVEYVKAMSSDAALVEEISKAAFSVLAAVDLLGE